MSDGWFVAIVVIGCLTEAVVFYVTGYIMGVVAERQLGGIRRGDQ